MRVIEIRLPLPLSLAEYHIGQLYMVARSSLEDSGVDVVENRSFVEGEYPPNRCGQYTLKRMAAAKHLPSWTRALFDERWCVEERSWNCFPDCRTEYSVPMLPKIKITVLSAHKDLTDNFCFEENALQLPALTVSQRKTEILDIAFDSEPAPPGLDPREKKFPGRPDLSKRNWWETTDRPLMVCYKVITIDAQLPFGLQGRVETFIHKFVKNLILQSHRKLYAWLEDWGAMDIEGLRNYERIVQKELKSRWAASHGEEQQEEVIIIEDTPKSNHQNNSTKSPLRDNTFVSVSLPVLSPRTPSFETPPESPVPGNLSICRPLPVSGYLFKQGDGYINRSWNLRFFRLLGSSLQYFSDAGDPRPRESIDIAGARVLMLSDIEDRSIEGVFAIHPKEHRILVVSGRNFDETQLWFNAALQASLICGSESNFVRSSSFESIPQERRPETPSSTQLTLPIGETAKSFFSVSSPKLFHSTSPFNRVRSAFFGNHSFPSKITEPCSERIAGNPVGTEIAVKSIPEDARHWRFKVPIGLPSEFAEAGREMARHLDSPGNLESIDGGVRITAKPCDNDRHAIISDIKENSIYWLFGMFMIFLLLPNFFKTILLLFAFVFWVKTKNRSSVACGVFVANYSLQDLSKIIEQISRYKQWDAGIARSFSEAKSEKLLPSKRKSGWFLDATPTSLISTDKYPVESFQLLLKGWGGAVRGKRVSLSEIPRAHFWLSVIGGGHWEGWAIREVAESRSEIFFVSNGLGFNTCKERIKQAAVGLAAWLTLRGKFEISSNIEDISYKRSIYGGLQREPGGLELSGMGFRVGLIWKFLFGSRRIKFEDVLPSKGLSPANAITQFFKSKKIPCDSPVLAVAKILIGGLRSGAAALDRVAWGKALKRGNRSEIVSTPEGDWEWISSADKGSHLSGNLSCVSSPDLKVGGDFEWSLSLGDSWGLEISISGDHWVEYDNVRVGFSLPTLVVGANRMTWKGFLKAWTDEARLVLKCEGGEEISGALLDGDLGKVRSVIEGDWVDQVLIDGKILWSVNQ